MGGGGKNPQKVFFQLPHPHQNFPIPHQNFLSPHQNFPPPPEKTKFVVVVMWIQMWRLTILPKRAQKGIICDPLPHDWNQMANVTNNISHDHDPKV